MSLSRHLQDRPDPGEKPKVPSLDTTPRPSQFNLKALLEGLDPEDFQNFKSIVQTLPEIGADIQTSSKIKEANGGELADILTDLMPLNSLRPMILQVLKKMNLLQLSKIKASRASGENDPVLEILEESVKTGMLYPDVKQRSIVEDLSLVYRTKFLLDSDHIQEVTQRTQKSIPFLSFKEVTKPTSHTVILYGPAGVGKSTVAKRYLQEWTNLGQAFRCAFYISCRELNHMAPCTFAQLISKDFPKWKDDIKEVVDRAQEVLFVVDGFDELKVPAGALIRDICGDWGEEKPVPILLSSLLKRKMVPKAKLLVTTRSQSVQELFILLDQPLLLEVEGFLEQDRKAYFLKYFRDEKRALQALEAMKCNAALFPMSSAPAVCWIACTSLELQMEKGDLALACQTCTDLFLHFLCSRFPSGDSPSDLKTPLEALCLLAAQGLWTQLSVFDEGDLWKLGLRDSDLQPFLDKKILRKENKDYYSFVHLSIQQFLAATFYILKHEEQQDGERPEWDICGVKKLFSREERIKNPNLVQAGRFLFGLLNKKRAQELETTFGCETSMEFKQELLQYKLEENKPCFSLMDLGEVFSCLYESQEEEIVKETMAPFEELSLHLKTTTDLMYSSFCLKKCQSLRRLSLKVAKEILSENDITLESYLQGDRVPPATHCLGLWTDLCSVICCNKNLSVLDINQSFLDELSVRILCNYLTYDSCRLQKVVIKNVSPPTSYRDICLALIGKETLTHLTLWGSVHEDKSRLLMILGEMFKNAKCNLQCLRLKSCSASTEQWDDFFLSLRSNRSLICLDLSDNCLKDEGAKMLCMTLKHPKCFLQRLSLDNCNLTYACCKELSSTLMINERLTHLSLSRNSLGDSGVTILCEGLCYPECKLQTLVLQQCGLTSHSCKYISNLLLGDCSVIHLDLSSNPIAIGLWLFCDALKNPNFNLKSLGLWGCSLSPLYCNELASALVSNPKLESLDLGQNGLGQRGVMEILGVLKNSSGPLKALRLKVDKCDVKVQTMLKEVRESNPSLQIDVTSTSTPSCWDFFI